MASRILVIDDDQDLVDLYRLLFEEEGYEVLFSMTAFEKISDIKHLHPDLILLDARFGAHQDGLLLAQQLKRDHLTQAIPVLLCTAAEDLLRQKEDMLRNQGIPFLAKPFDIEELLRKVQHLLSASLTYEDAQGTAAWES